MILYLRGNDNILARKTLASKYMFQANSKDMYRPSPGVSVSLNLNRDWPRFMFKVTVMTAKRNCEH